MTTTNDMFFATIVNSDPWQEMKFEVLILSFFDSLEAQDCLINP
jgi:hypothetical protein